ncbi:hypothetical protein D9756_005656 [Leucocoprinus leucothites]|uniref:Microbial-type PARG catalytic domain-containing protein n=1 Tax=Leucocoprinus leucothites TaxID=201217 RepID=A0A8H5FZL2_9AGAR|nr:hypothetical protein D9756_005656 [Leucoagaricus leucothites]
MFRGIRFCIHSYFLERDSYYWKKLLSEDDFPGSNEMAPFILDEDPDDLANFLWVFYNPIYEATDTQWMAIFRLATKWQCPDIREFAISYLETLSVELGELPPPGFSGPTFSSACDSLSYKEPSQIAAEVSGPGVDLESSVEPLSDHEAISNFGEERQDNDASIAGIFSGEVEGQMPDETGSESSSEALDPIDPIIGEWEIIRMDKHDRTSARSEHYTRLPVMRHDFILPYCLVISFIEHSRIASIIDNAAQRKRNRQKNQRRGLGKDVLARIAGETIDAIETGSYTLPNPQTRPNDPVTTIDLRANVENLKVNTTYYAPDSAIASWAQTSSQSQDTPSIARSTKIWAVEKSTLETSRWLVEKLASEPQTTSGKVSGPQGRRAHAVGVLNFASARNPGGGFKTGARAQEESIARSSTLYPSLTCSIGQQFYDYHHSITDKGKNTGYYSHAIIYSPSVLVFRNDAGTWVRPFEIDILTSPAVNAGVVRQKRQQAIDRARQSHIPKRTWRLEFTRP